MTFMPQIQHNTVQFSPCFEDSVRLYTNEVYQGVRVIKPQKKYQILPTADKVVPFDFLVTPIPNDYVRAVVQEDCLSIPDESGTDIKKVTLGDSSVYYDISDSTVKAASMRIGSKAYTASGECVEGSIANYSGSTLVTDTCLLPTAGKYMPHDLMISCDVGRSRTGTFVPDGNITSYTVDTLGSFHPTGGALIAQSVMNSESVLMAAYIGGLHFWTTTQMTTIGGGIWFRDGGAQFTVPTGMVLGSGVTYRWYLY